MSYLFSYFLFLILILNIVYVAMCIVPICLLVYRKEDFPIRFSGIKWVYVMCERV